MYIDVYRYIDGCKSMSFCPAAAQAPSPPSPFFLSSPLRKVQIAACKSKDVLLQHDKPSTAWMKMGAALI